MHTRSPTLNSSTWLPSAATVPVHSWPGVNSPNGGVCGKCPSKIFRSVPHVPHMATWTSTSSGPGTGTGLPTTLMSPGPKSTAARIVSGTSDVVPTRSARLIGVGHRSELADHRADRAGVHERRHRRLGAGQDFVLLHSRDRVADTRQVKAAVQREHAFLGEQHAVRLADRGGSVTGVLRDDRDGRCLVV